MTPDTGDPNPGKPDSWNRYSYVMGDPINRTDHSGHDCEGVTDDSDCPGIQGNPGGCVVDAYDPVPLDPGCYQPVQWAGSLQGFTTTEPAIASPIPHRPSRHAQYPSGKDQLQPHPGQAGIHLLSATYSNPALGTNVTEDFEGGPYPSSALIGGKLLGTIAAPGQGLAGFGANDATGPGLPSNFEVGDPFTGPGACLDVSLLFNLVESYNNNGHPVTYDFTAIGGYNSNSFAYTLDVQLGLLNYFGNPGGPLPGGGILLIPGWGKLVLGL